MSAEHTTVEQQSSMPILYEDWYVSPRAHGTLGIRKEFPAEWELSEHESMALSTVIYGYRQHWPENPSVGESFTDLVKAHSERSDWKLAELKHEDGFIFVPGLKIRVPV